MYVYDFDPTMPRNTFEVRNINQNGRLLLEKMQINTNQDIKWENIW